MAVPLGDGAPSSQAPSTSWTLPSPRAGLDIRVGAKPAGPGFGTSLYERIRALYRATAERLEAEGRVEEAAFVHAELLGDLAGAVSLLERHGRLVRAAELAEAAKLLPELVIRQWIVAGDVDRAALHARRTKSFQVAVTKLEGSDAALALPLRREWARCAAACGRPRARRRDRLGEARAPRDDGRVDRGRRRAGRRRGRAHARAEAHAAPRAPRGGARRALVAGGGSLPRWGAREGSVRAGHPPGPDVACVAGRVEGGRAVHHRRRRAGRARGRPRGGGQAHRARARQRAQDGHPGVARGDAAAALRGCVAEDLRGRRRRRRDARAP